MGNEGSCGLCDDGDGDLGGYHEGAANPETGNPGNPGPNPGNPDEPQRSAPVDKPGGRVTVEETDALYRALLGESHVNNQFWRAQNLYVSNIEEWLMEMEGNPQDTNKRKDVKRKAKDVVQAMGDGTKADIHGWNKWMSQKRNQLGEDRFREWFNGDAGLWLSLV